MFKSIVSFAITFMAIFFISCGNNENKTPEQPAPETEQTVLPGSEAELPPNTMAIEISGTDQMKYDKEELRVKQGMTIRLTLKHAGKLPKAAMGHNVVILKQGVDMVKFATAAAAASATDYIPESEKAGIVAHTKMIGGGESDTIEFTAPAKGTYQFFCSFPGHYSMMKGNFIVE